MIKLSHINKTYTTGHHTIYALHDLNLSIADGELVALIGASGSGKTTTMNIIGLLDKPSSGHYYLNGTEVSNLSGNAASLFRNQTIGFIFQQFFLLPRFNALQNVALPLTYRNMPPPQIEKLAMASLEKTGLGDLYDHRPNQLSGGQQQRVAIARALVGQPKIILADEPTGSLDSKTGQAIMNLLLEINQRDKTTIIIVTHDFHIAEQCNRIVQIADGKIVGETLKKL
ncbi:MAG TPA: ABC transporter ATP-binding protein [Gammaproteobacteria bacterium]|nr:ABC transporter ATP-binding protein [Gammaproteobacteria bacterium]